MNNELINKKNLLMVVDYQNDFVSPTGKIADVLKDGLFSSQKISSKIQKLINFWHKKNAPIVFLVSDYNTKHCIGEYKKFKKSGPYGDIAKKGTWGFELYKITPLEKDKFIIKNFMDGFYKTKLREYLKSKKISTLYFCGINTDVCVFHTAIGAAVRGYKVFIIEDATATPNKKNKKIFIDYMRDIVGIKPILAKEIVK